MCGLLLQKGTLMLKEMLKIDGAGAGSHSSQEAANSATYGGQQQNRRRSSKKLGTSLINASPASLLQAESTTEEVACLYTPSAMFHDFSLSTHFLLLQQQI